MAPGCHFDASTPLGQAGADDSILPDAGACAPQVCQPEQCGLQDDTCGGTIDCGECPCQGYPFEDSCGGSEICVETECSAAFDREYELSIPELTVTPQNPNGNAWDFLGSDPDPFVVVSLNGDEVLNTSTAQNVLTATYDERVVVTVPDGARLRILARDSDTGADDDIIACEFDPLNADALGLRILSCEGTADNNTLGTTLKIQLLPQ
jgi:hypothetical protein